MSQNVTKHKIWAIALVSITVLLCVAWVSSPTDFTFGFESDNNTVSIAESVQNPIYICVNGGQLYVMNEEVVDLRGIDETFCAWFREADYEY